jgi:large subunit ribosomal protein L18
MENIAHKLGNKLQRKARIRSTVSGTKDRPRLSIFISNRHVNAQIIDDDKGKTLAYVTTVGQKISGTMSERAAWVGTEIAKKAKTAKIKHVVFDRGGKLYHGRAAALADAARKSGLEF